jgi:hypothetical protein
MTTYREKDVKCAVCGTSNKVLLISSTNQFGAIDLDSRPPEMERSTMSAWVQSCSKCGYSSNNIAKANETVKSVISTEEYKALLNDKTLPPLAKKFLCNAIIQEETHNLDSSMYNFLYAAWDCDDNENINNSMKLDNKAIESKNKAIECRNRALKLIGTFFVPQRHKPTIELIKLDLLRRTGRFEEAIEYSKTLNIEDNLVAVAKFQVKLCKKKDTQAHNVREIKV